MSEPRTALVALGFSRIEAEVYLHLASESPATGYRVAQALGKPAAQVYRTLEALERKGAVLVHGGESRLCRPVAVDELVAKLRRDLELKGEQAVAALRSLPAPANDDLIYSLGSRTALFERLRTLLARSRRVVLLDLFPAAVEPLGEAIAEATGRGVATLVKLYRPAELDATLALVSNHTDRVLEVWPGQEVTAVADAREFVSARLSRDGRRLDTAFWSENPTLAGAMHNGKICELGWTRLEALLLADAPRAELLRANEEVRRHVLTRLLTETAAAGDDPGR